MTEDLEHKSHAARVEDVRVADLLVIDHRRVKVGEEEEHCPMKLGRGDSDDREGVLVDPDHAANGARVIVEMRAPVAVREDDIGRAVGPVFVRGVKEAAEVRLDAEDVEVVAARGLDPNAG